MPPRAARSLSSGHSLWRSVSSFFALDSRRRKRDWFTAPTNFGRCKVCNGGLAAESRGRVRVRRVGLDDARVSRRHESRQFCFLARTRGVSKTLSKTIGTDEGANAIAVSRVPFEPRVQIIGDGCAGRSPASRRESLSSRSTKGDSVAVNARQSLPPLR
jgi:hypothetical protein